LQPAIQGGRDVILIRLPNRKNRDRHFKDIPIPMDKEAELMQPVLDFVRGKSGHIFSFQSTSSAWKILKKIGYSPHWLRHIRLTHLVTIYDMNEALIRKFAGWTDTRPAKHYMELKWTDILQKM